MAHVVRDGVLQKGMFGGQQQAVDLETESVALPDGSRFNAPIGLRLSIYARKSDYEDEEQQAAGALPLPVLQYGQRVRLTAKLHEPRNYRNPGAWNYRGYLQAQGIALLGNARVSTVELLPGFAGHRWIAWQHHARAAVLHGIHELWPREEAALFGAIVIGDRSELGDEVKTSFQSTGTFHILVVSGMNVGILAFAFFWLFRRCKMGDVLATLCTLAISFGYAWLTDLGSPILRAVWTLTIYLLARLLFRQSFAPQRHWHSGAGYSRVGSGGTLRCQLPAHVSLRRRDCRSRLAMDRAHLGAVPQGVAQSARAAF
jgi:competence protein ComEC